MDNRNDSWREVNYLTQLIDQRMKENLATSSNTLHHPGIPKNTQHTLPFIKSDQHVTHLNNVVMQSNNRRIYINPNYQKKQPVIYINPDKYRKGIHVNPKVIKMKPSTTEQPKKQDIVPNEKQTILTKIGDSAKAKSVYVKPELMKRLVSNVNKKEIYQNEQKEQKLENLSTERYKILSTTKLVKNILPTKKAVTSNCVSLYKKKLIKYIPKSLYSSGNGHSPSILKFKKQLIPDRRKLFINNVNCGKLVRRLNESNDIEARKQTAKLSQLNKYKIDRTAVLNGHKKLKQCTVSKYKVDRTDRSKGVKKSRSSLTMNYKVDSSKFKRLKLNITANKYKVDRTIMQRGIKRKSQSFGNKKMRERSSTVVISGHSYKKSRNKLVKRPEVLSPVKRIRSLPVTATEQFLVTKNGKKLHRVVITTSSLNSKKNVSNISGTKNSSFKSKKSFTVPKRNQMKYLSTNARQRSLQLMQNKLHKNNQPCLVFRKYGYCPKQERGTCSKVHDEKKVALCQKFLQGKCLSENCKLSHNIGPEKVPTCKYFLEGCCNRDSCPYRHIKVSDKTPICVQFLEGYCERGNECKHRHIFLCPEFEKTGKCSKGKNCLYPHKSTKMSKKSKRDIVVKGSIKEYETSKRNVSMKTIGIQETEKTGNRYYSDVSSQNLERKRIKLLNQVSVMKKAHITDSDGKEQTREEYDMYLDNDEDIIVECVRIKKPPLGSLPAFIPID